MPASILIVDDKNENIKVLVSLLNEENYIIRVATSGLQAIESLNIELCDLVLLDVLLPDMNGYEVCRRIKENERTGDIPVVFITAVVQLGKEKDGLSVGAIDYITKPIHGDLVKARIKNILELKAYQNNLKKLIEQKTKKLKTTQNAIIRSLGKIAEYRDLDTGEHIQRTTDYMRLMLEDSEIIEKLGQLKLLQETELIIRSAPLHDIGKVAIPDMILLKAGKLTSEEFEVMKQHTTLGKHIIRDIIHDAGDDRYLKFAEEISISHHEKWNGTGYPYGLAGFDIPLTGRVMALVDVYDALRSKRVYKPAFSHEKAKSIIIEGKGEHFDPLMVEVFIKLETQFEKLSSNIR